MFQCNITKCEIHIDVPLYGAQFGVNKTEICVKLAKYFDIRKNCNANDNLGKYICFL